MSLKSKVGVIGATGYVGQQFINLLDNHPWFDLVSVAASNSSAGKSFEEAVSGRWKLGGQIPEYAKNMEVKSIDDIENFCGGLDFVFCAVKMEKEKILELEEKIAKLEVPVVSNNSEYRMYPDIPMIIPEINPQHSEIIKAQRSRLGTKRGFITAKPNCSIQSYVPAITPLMKYKPTKISVCTYQAISGAGKALSDAPEIINNVIPYIGGEEEKSEKEPLKIWGQIVGNEIVCAKAPVISAQCYRVCVQDGHTAAVSVSFENKPSVDEILSAWENFETEAQKQKLPSAPKPFIRYMSEANRPQPILDVNFGNGFGISVGHLREDNIFDYKFTCLSHNTLRGAAGGSLLTAELLKSYGYL
ncbi:MAG: aspartate-semialdehyde dehydrogenase [Clostridiales bacterium]|nr:aspartate-semialdehyde dehydrogenase [Clostridiales bacterium]